MPVTLREIATGFERPFLSHRQAALSAQVTTDTIREYADYTASVNTPAYGRVQVYHEGKPLRAGSPPSYRQRMQAQPEYPGVDYYGLEPGKTYVLDGNTLEEIGRYDSQEKAGHAFGRSGTFVCNHLNRSLA